MDEILEEIKIEDCDEDYVESEIPCEHEQQQSHENSISIIDQKPNIEPNGELSNAVPIETIERFLCSLCYGIFEELTSLRSHMIEVHNYRPKKQPDIDEKETNRIETEEEREVWLKPVSLKALKLKLKKNFTIKCTIEGCHCLFETIDKKLVHERCHSVLGRGFRCIDCKMELENWRNCSMHMWKHHKRDVDLLKCPFCAYKAGVSVLIYRHLQIHGTTKGFACSECPKTFRQYAQLRFHAAIHKSKMVTVENSRRWYTQKTCTICENVFANSKTLSKHIKTVHNKLKPFICNICGHKTARKASLQVHMRQHTGERPLKCKECSFRAADPNCLKTHKLRHSDQPMYRCDYCNFTGIQPTAFKSHLRKYHNDEYILHHACDQCKFVTVNRKRLERHKKEHQLGLIKDEDSNEADLSNSFKDPKPYGNHSDKSNGNVEISSDCFLPLESTDAYAHDPPVDTGGVTIPAHSEETQFPHFN